MRGIGTDISVPVIPVFSDENLPHTISELKRMNLLIPCLDSDCCIHLRDNETPVDIEVEAYLTLAKKLRTPYVRVMAAAPVPKPVGKVDDGYVRDHAARLAVKAKAYGVKLLIETHGVWSDSEKLARLLEAIDSPFVGALWDVHHPYRFKGESPQVTCDNLRPWICHTHLKDSQKTADGYRYTLPGFGDVPLEAAAHTLQGIGYDGFYSLEWVKRWDTTLEEPGIVFAHFANYMRTLL
jgi:fatty-acyl-CoA synthase